MAPTATVLVLFIVVLFIAIVLGICLWAVVSVLAPSASSSPFPPREQLLVAAVGGAVVIAVVVVVVMVVVVMVVVVVIVMVMVVSFSSPSLSPTVAILIVGLCPLVPSLLVLVSAYPVPWFCCRGSTSFSLQLLIAMGCRWPSLSVPRRPAPLSLLSAVIRCPDPLSTP